MHLITTDDLGETWSDPINVAEGVDQVHPDIAVGSDDSGDYLYVVFEKLGWDGNDWVQQIWITQSNNHGNTWRSPAQLTSWSTKSTLPRITASDGNLLGAYIYDYSNDGSDLDANGLYSNDNGNSWNSRVISNSFDSKIAVEIDVSHDNNGKFHAVYHVNNTLQYKNTDITTYTAWSSPIRVDDEDNSFVSADYPMPALAINPKRLIDMQAYFAWTDYRRAPYYDIYFNTFSSQIYLPAIYYLLQ